MSSNLEIAKGYWDLKMHDEAREVLASIPPDDSEFLAAWSQLTLLSNREDKTEEAVLAGRGMAMIEAGVRASGVIHNTALCHFFAGDFQAAYDLTVRFQAHASLDSR